jgi:branched-chain amino acid transport system ATP-binding protein
MVSMLEVCSLSVWHGRVQAVRQASLKVEPGEIVALLGANGAGKSSLLWAIAGGIRSVEGQVRLDGQELTRLPPERIAALGVALVPEGRQLFGTMSVRDNLLLGAYLPLCRHKANLLRPLPLVRASALVQARLSAVLSLFPALSQRQEQLAQSLSGGEQQMLAIGRALMAQPRVLLLDEPSVGLAPELVRTLLRLLQQLRQEGLAILLVEQEVHGALSIASRAYIMETGRIVAEGTPAQLMQSAALRQAYLGLS